VPVDKIIEIRVHGVSGTPPNAALGTQPWPVTGPRAPDIEVWRHPQRTLSMDLGEGSDARRVDLDQIAYRWARLTSGKRRYALWLLLLPYTLVNVAGWMLPSRVRPNRELVTAPDRPTPMSRRLAGTLDGAVRLAGVAVTAIFALYAAAITLDLGVATCRPGTDTCNWLSTFPSLEPGVYAVLGTLLPILLTVGVAAIIGREKRLRHLATEARSNLPAQLVSDAASDQDLTRGADPVAVYDLMTPELWQPHRIAFSLGLIHSAAAAVTMAWVLLGSVWDMVGTGWRVAGVFTAAVATLAVVAGVGAASGRLHRDHIYRSVAIAVVAVSGAAFVVAAAAGFAAEDVPFAMLRTQPAMHRASIAVVLIIGMVAALVGLVGFGSQRSTAGPGSMLVLAGLVGAAFGAGTYSLTRTMLTAGRPAADVPPLPGLDWTALGFLVVLLVLAGVMVMGIARAWKKGPDRSAAMLGSLRALTGALRVYFLVIVLTTIVGIIVFLWSVIVRDPPVRSPFGPDFPAAIIVGVLAVALALAVVVLAFQYGGWVWGAVAAVGIAVGGSLIAAGHVPDVSLFGVSLEFGSLREIALSLAVILPAGFIISRLISTLRDAEARRGIAMLWDLGSFWPRWYHPFAAPYYTPIVVPDLQALIAEQIAEPHQGVIVAAHSQGTVIAMASLLAVPDANVPAPPSVALVTYGSPISHLYERLFPSYFSREAITQLQTRFGGEARSRWNNLWRDTDPIGGAVDCAAVDYDVTGDRESGFEPDVEGPVGTGHSHYEKTLMYAAALQRVAALLEEAAPVAEETQAAL
jgi:hypothetical protein